MKSPQLPPYSRHNAAKASVEQCTAGKPQIKPRSIAKSLYFKRFEPALDRSHARLRLWARHLLADSTPCFRQMVTANSQNGCGQRDRTSSSGADRVLKTPCN